jgi:phage terminase large subunit-like protein
MDTNKEYVKRSDDRQGNHPHPHYDFTEQPPYKFYGQGITEAHKGWWEVIAASIRNAHGKYLVTIVAVWALCKVACEFLEKGSNNLSYKSIIGTLLFGLMILIIGLVSLRRVEDTNVGQKEKRKKDKVESVESGTGRISPGQDRRPSTRDGGSNLDGGGK